MYIIHHHEVFRPIRKLHGCNSSHASHTIQRRYKPLLSPNKYKAASGDTS